MMKSRCVLIHRLYLSVWEWVGKCSLSPKDVSNPERLSLLLEHGDVIVMHPPTQEKLKHCIPMMRKLTSSRFEPDI